jgi:hypothetical protein
MFFVYKTLWDKLPAVTLILCLRMMSCPVRVFGNYYLLFENEMSNVRV